MRILLALLLSPAILASQAVPDRSAVLQEEAKLVTAGQLSQAQDLLEKAITRFPKDPELQFELGMLYFRQKNWGEAIASYRASITSAPDRIKTLYYLAESYGMTSDLDAARETMARAASLAPNDAQVCQKYGEILTSTIDTRQQGLDWLEKSRKMNPNLPRIDFDIGKTQFELTNPGSAKASLETALKKNPEDGEAAYFLAETWANLGEWEKARDNYRYALSHAYENGPTYYALGRALVELGDSAVAVEPLEHALSLEPSLVKAHFQLGKAYRQLARTQDAQHEAKLYSLMSERVDTAQALNDPDQVRAWKQVRPLLEKNDERQALNALDKSPASEAEGSHYLLGSMYFSMGRKDDARRMLSIARKENPKSAKAAAFLGMIDLASGETAAAEESFRAALAVNSGEPLALIGMGTIRYQQQRWVESAEYLEKSRTADPGAMYMLCDVYFRIARSDDALLMAEVVRAYAGDQKSLLDQLDKLIREHQNQ
jgi:tetratricopeptide (TPR) repeat protein